MDHNVIQHVYPIHDPREHVTDKGGDCWCGPLLKRLCSQCVGPDPDCWMCGGSGLISVTEITPGESIIVIHHLATETAENSYEQH